MRSFTDKRSLLVLDTRRASTSIFLRQSFGSTIHSKPSLLLIDKKSQYGHYIVELLEPPLEKNIIITSSFLTFPYHMLTLVAASPQQQVKGLSKCIICVQLNE